MNVLIAGGSGFIGKSLSKLLIENGFQVSILTRNPKLSTKVVNEFFWNLDNFYIDIKAFDGVDAIINLAGENIGAKRWSVEQKYKIEHSRIASTQLLYYYVAQLAVKPTLYISASAVGIYGYDRGELPMTESDLCGTDFLAQVCHKWEIEALKFQALGLRTCCVRTGIVLSKSDGVLKQVLASLKFNFLFRFGSGKQPFPWIDIVDLCRIYTHLLNSETSNGVFNATAPAQDSFNNVLDAIASQQSNKPYVFTVPKFILKLVLGEMATILLNGSNISSKKIVDLGFVFKSDTISSVLMSGSE